MSVEVNVNQAKANLAQLLNQALAGEDVVIMRSGRPVARLTPVQDDSDNSSLDASLFAFEL